MYGRSQWFSLSFCIIIVVAIIIMHFKQFHCGKTFAQVLTILAQNSDKILF